MFVKERAHLWTGGDCVKQNPGEGKSLSEIFLGWQREQYWAKPAGNTETETWGVPLRFKMWHPYSRCHLQQRSRRCAWWPQRRSCTRRIVVLAPSLASTVLWWWLVRQDNSAEIPDPENPFALSTVGTHLFFYLKKKKKNFFPPANCGHTQSKIPCWFAAENPAINAGWPYQLDAQTPS